MFTSLMYFSFHKLTRLEWLVGSLKSGPVVFRNVFTDLTNGDRDLDVTLDSLFSRRPMCLLDTHFSLMSHVTESLNFPCLRKQVYCTKILQFYIPRHLFSTETTSPFRLQVHRVTKRTTTNSWFKSNFWYIRLSSRHHYFGDTPVQYRCRGVSRTPR